MSDHHKEREESERKEAERLMSLIGGEVVVEAVEVDELLGVIILTVRRDSDLSRTRLRFGTYCGDVVAEADSHEHFEPPGLTVRADNLRDLAG